MWARTAIILAAIGLMSLPLQARAQDEPEHRTPEITRHVVVAAGRLQQAQSEEEDSIRLAAYQAALEVVYDAIEDDPGNTTRFVILGKKSPPPSGNDVTSLMFTTPNRPGALHEVLKILAADDISLTRIESRSLRQTAWDYIFFVDIEGHADIPSVRDALARLKDKTSLLKILGSYPRAVL